MNKSKKNFNTEQHRKDGKLLKMGLNTETHLNLQTTEIMLFISVFLVLNFLFSI